jgi:beta-galactosidase/beta-glucuronidase
MYPHHIRLRGPWECEPLARFAVAADGRKETTTVNLPAPRKMTMPCRWSEGGLKDFTGRVRFRRHFGYPGRIDDNERVWLTFAGVEGIAEIWVNTEFLGRREAAQRPFEFDITRLLRDRNELHVEVEGPETGGLSGEVALEIRLVEKDANSC